MRFGAAPQDDAPVLHPLRDRRIDSWIIQLKAQGPSRTCNESNAEEEKSLGQHPQMMHPYCTRSVVWVWGVGCGVWGVGCGVQGLGLRVCGLGQHPQMMHPYCTRSVISVCDTWLRAQGSGVYGFRVQGLHSPHIWVQGSGLRAQGSGV